MSIFHFYAVITFCLAKLGHGNIKNGQLLIFSILYPIASVSGKITSSNQLNSDFFNSFGRWTSVINGSDAVEWKIASIVATDFFHSIPRGVLGQGRFSLKIVQGCFMTLFYIMS